MMTFGDFVNWVEPNGNYGHNYCIQCGRKTGKNAYLVNVSTSGAVLHPASEADSQGFWHIGTECAKKFDRAVLVKN
jgi:hypothetical protein